MIWESGGFISVQADCINVIIHIVEPIDFTRWCPADTAIRKTWHYCKDCEARRKARRCPYMWLYWERKKLSETDPPPPLEVYDRVCLSCGSKLTLHHALIHLLNASGYRNVNVGFDHKKQIAYFENCPYCFSGIGWFPGKPPPEEEISTEQALVLDRIMRLEKLLDAETDDVEERHKRISRAVRGKREIDTDFVRFIEYEGADIVSPDSTEQKPSGRVPKRKVAEKIEWIFPREDESLEEVDADLAADLHSSNDDTPFGIELPFEDEADSALDSVPGADDEVPSLESLRDPAAELGSTDNEVLGEPYEVDPVLDGISRCPNHPNRNADRECPLCHQKYCSDCMFLVNGVYGCGGCFDNPKIRRMYDLPRDWKTRRPAEFEPSPIPKEYRGFGLVKITYEGVPANPGHRLIAHLADALLAALILGLLQFLFSGPFNRAFEALHQSVMAVLKRVHFNNVDYHSLLADLPHAEAVGRAFGFGWLMDFGVAAHLAWWIVGLPLLTWYFIAIWTTRTSRSPGQTMCNLIVVREDGTRLGLWANLVRAAGAVAGVLSFGLLAFLSYTSGPADRIGFVDGISHFRVVTYSGQRIRPPDGRIIMVAAVDGRAPPSETAPQGEEDNS